MFIWASLIVHESVPYVSFSLSLITILSVFWMKVSVEINYMVESDLEEFFDNLEKS